MMTVQQLMDILAAHRPDTVVLTTAYMGGVLDVDPQVNLVWAKPDSHPNYYTGAYDVEDNPADDRFPAIILDCVDPPDADDDYNPHRVFQTDLVGPAHAPQSGPHRGERPF